MVQKIHLAVFMYMAVKVWIIMISFVLLLLKETTRGMFYKANFFFL